METIKRVCLVCGNQCELEIEIEDGEMLDVTGNNCMKGMIYAQREVNKLEEK